ncbi:hypothetical protein U1Q18_021561 [Sarracenia purpurea var. burkii]
MATQELNGMNKASVKRSSPPHPRSSNALGLVVELVRLLLPVVEDDDKELSKTSENSLLLLVVVVVVIGQMGLRQLREVWVLVLMKGVSKISSTVLEDEKVVRDGAGSPGLAAIEEMEFLESKALFQKPKSISSSVLLQPDVGLLLGGLIWRERSGCAGNSSIDLLQPNKPLQY